MILCVCWLQASRNLKVNVEGNKKKPMAQDIAQSFKKIRLASHNKSVTDTSKVSKRKVPDSEENCEASEVKSSKCKPLKPSLESEECKPCDGSKTMESDCNDVAKGEGRVSLKASIVFHNFAGRFSPVML